MPGKRRVIMAEKIDDAFFSRRIFIQVEDIYTGMTDVANMLSKLGAMEIQNLYETDGPHKRASYAAELVKTLDRNSRLRLVFSAKGESTFNTLTLDITAEFQTRMTEGTGIMTKTFHEYYMAHVSPFLRKLAEQELNSMWGAIEYQIRLRFKYSFA